MLNIKIIMVSPQNDEAQNPINFVVNFSNLLS